MDAERWARVQELFHLVADLPEGERAAALESACAGDATLRRDVQALLDADAGGESLLDRGVAHAAREVMSARDDGPALGEIRCGPYRLLRTIGEGGMGAVYLARRDDLGSEAAVKLLRDAWASPARRERFLAEQRTLAQLNHPGIARLFDAGTLPEGTPWIAMEHIDGVPLKGYVAEHGLPLRERLRLVRAVGEAVMHAHQHLVVHRDLKPSNILVRADGVVKLLDFGIAKQLEGGDAGDATLTGMRLMTPAYAAPEQVTGGRIGVHTDVYALGVVLYELLAGALPFDVAGRSTGEVEAMIVASEPPRPSLRAAAAATAAARAGSGVRVTSPAPLTPVTASAREWGDLDVLALTAMHKEPERRYRSMEAFLRDIDRFLNGAPLEARGDSFGYRASKFARRNAQALAVTMVVAVILVALTAFYTWRLREARDRALAESVRAQRIQRFITTLFQGGEEAAGPAESLRVVTLLDQGVADARALDLEPRVQADMYQTLGGIFAQLGALDRADSLLSTALAEWRRTTGEGSTEAGRALRALGDLRTSQARYDEAERLLQQALRADLAAGAPNAEETVAVRTALGRLYTERGEHARAIATLDSVVAGLRAGGADARALHEVLGELANAQFYAGDYAAADSLNHQVLAMTKALYGMRHPRVAEDLMNLGATEQERGNFKEGERYFRQSLEISTAFYGKDHFRTAGNLTYLGRSLLSQGRYAESREIFERALAIRERVFGTMHPFVANTLNELGNVAIREERYADAVPIFERVRDIYRRAYSGANYRVGVAMANMADAYMYQKSYAKAEPLYREALATYIASQGPDHLNTGIGYIKLGRVLLRSGRFREAIPQTERGYAIVAKVAEPGISFLQAARLDLSLAFDSTGRREDAARWRAEREKYMPKPQP